MVVNIKLQKTLEKLGYHRHDVRIYLAALALGEATASELAQYAEMPRTTTVETIEYMSKKGLLVSYLKGLKKYWVAENPEKILSDYRANEKILESIVPELISIKKEIVHKPLTKFFTGITEIKKILDDVIDSKHHVASLIALEDWFKFFGEEHTYEFIKKRSKSFLRIRILTTLSETSRELKKNDARELRHIKFLPNNVQLRQVVNFIYGDKVAIISFNKKSPSGVIIEDEDVAKAHMLYFENLWEQSTEN